MVSETMNIHPFPAILTFDLLMEKFGIMKNTTTIRTIHLKPPYFIRCLSILMLAVFVQQAFLNRSAESSPLYYDGENSTIRQIDDYVDLGEEHDVALLYFVKKDPDDQFTLLVKSSITSITRGDQQTFEVQLLDRIELETQNGMTIHGHDGTVIPSVILITWWQGWLYYQDNSTFGTKKSSMILLKNVQRIVSPNLRDIHVTPFIEILGKKKKKSSAQKQKTVVQIGYDYIIPSFTEKNEFFYLPTQLHLDFDNGHGFYGAIKRYREESGIGWGAQLGASSYKGKVKVEENLYQDQIPLLTSHYSLTIFGLCTKKLWWNLRGTLEFGLFVDHTQIEIAENPYLYEEQTNATFYGVELGGNLSVPVNRTFELGLDFHYRPVLNEVSEKMNLHYFWHSPEYSYTRAQVEFALQQEVLVGIHCNFLL